MTTAHDQPSRAELLQRPLDQRQHYEIVVSDQEDRVILALTAEDLAAIAVGTRRAVLVDTTPQVQALLAQDLEPVAGQSRFFPYEPWRPCAAEHVRMVLAAPQDWEGYEVRYLYAAAPRPPAAQECKPQAYRLLERGVDTIQADDEFLCDDVATWQAVGRGIFVGMVYLGGMLPARRAIEAVQGIK